MASTWTQRLDTGKPSKKILLTKDSSKALLYTVSDGLKGEVPQTALFMLKLKRTDLDSEALVTKRITQTPSDDGVIKIGSGSTNTTYEFVINADVCDGLDTALSYSIGVKSIYVSGKAYVHPKTVTTVRILEPIIEENAIVFGSGASTITISAEATGEVNGSPQGSAELTIQSSGIGRRIVKGSGSASVTVSGLATGSARQVGSASASVSVSAEANAETFAPEARWGVNFRPSDSNGIPTNQELTLLGDMNCKIIRRDLLWNSVEQSAGVYTWTKYDDFTAAIDAVNIKAHFILSYNNDLFVSDVKIGPTTPTNRAAFVAWAKATVDRYKNRGYVWEIWNEPNLSRFWAPTPNVADYLALVIETVQAIRSVAPDEYIMAGAVSGFDWTFLEYLCENGMLDHVDAVSVHPYRHGKAPETVEEDWARLRNTISANTNRAVGIYCSEWGYSTANIHFEYPPEDYHACGATPVAPNTLINTESLSTAGSGWSKLNGALVTSLGSGEFRISPPNSSPTDPHAIAQNGSPIVGKSYNVSCWLRSPSGKLKIKLGIGATTPLSETILIDETWRRYSVTVYYTGVELTSRLFRAGVAEAGNTPFEIAFPQSEELTLDASTRQTWLDTRQGDYAARAVQVNMMQGVVSSIWYEFRDFVSASNASERVYGTVRDDWSLKPAYERLRDMGV